MTHKITSTSNDLVKHAVKLQKDKAYRTSTGHLLVLGNEAHGAALPQSLPKQLIRIPMSSKVESLNVAQAGAIALYSLTQV